MLGDLDAFDRPQRPDWGDFEPCIHDLLTDLDLAHYSYLGVRRPAGAPDDGAVALRTSYHKDWVDRYCARRYDRIDPLGDLARTARSPFFWGTKRFVDRFEKQQRRIFAEGRDFGIHYGISIPVVAVGGTLSVVSFVGKNRTSLHDVVHDHGARLHLAAHQICDQIDPEVQRATDPGSTLTVRERECLFWVTQGLTSDEIADRLFLSVSTVNYHLGNSVRKLHARNRHHAALLGLQKDLF